MTHRKDQEELLRHMRGFAERADALFAAIDLGVAFVEDDESTDPTEVLNTLALEVTEERYVRMVLCTGGPHVEVSARVDNDGTPYNHRLRATWVGASFDEPIDEDSGLARALDNYAELMRL